MRPAHRTGDGGIGYRAATQYRGLVDGVDIPAPLGNGECLQGASDLVIEVPELGFTTDPWFYIDRRIFGSQVRFVQIDIEGEIESRPYIFNGIESKIPPVCQRGSLDFPFVVVIVAGSWQGRARLDVAIIDIGPGYSLFHLEIIDARCARRDDVPCPDLVVIAPVIGIQVAYVGSQHHSGKLILNAIVRAGSRLKILGWRRGRRGGGDKESSAPGKHAESQ